jgi:hypothetical protein
MAGSPENDLLKEVQTLRWALTLLTVVTLGTLLYAISAISQQTVAVLDQVTELKVMAEAINSKIKLDTTGSTFTHEARRTARAAANAAKNAAEAAADAPTNAAANPANTTK